MRTQEVLSEKGRVFVEKYLTKTGKKKLELAKTKKEKETVWKEYGKNRYKKNPNAKVINFLRHDN